MCFGGMNAGNSMMGISDIKITNADIWISLVSDRKPCSGAKPPGKVSPD